VTHTSFAFVPPEVLSCHNFSWVALTSESTDSSNYFVWQVHFTIHSVYSGGITEFSIFCQVCHQDLLL